MLQPPAAARPWARPLLGGLSWAPPSMQSPAARLSTRVIISQDLWRKPKSRAVLVINQKFFAQFPNRFPGDLLLWTPQCTASSPWMAAPSLQAQGLGWGETPGFGIIQAPPSINKSPWMHRNKPQQGPPLPSNPTSVPTGFYLGGMEPCCF